MTKGKMMWAVMLGNTLIKGMWVTATVYLVMHGHPWWAGATIIGAFVSEFTLKHKG